MTMNIARDDEIASAKFVYHNNVINTPS